MPNWELVDDASSYITYSGSWARQSGSSRQWNSGVQSTSQVGATATFRFRGTAVQVHGTVPAGSGTARSRYTIDNGSPITVERRCGSGDVYNDLFLDQSGLREADHTLVITNMGSEADFRLDKIDWLPVANDPDSETPLPPVIAPPQPPASSATTNSPPNVINPPTSVVTQTVTTTSSAAGGSTSTVTTTGQETKTETGTDVQVVTSTYTSNGTPVATTILRTSSTSSLSTTVIVTTDASGRESTGTMIVMVSDGHTTTVEATSIISAAAGQSGAASGLSKGAVGGIVAAVLIILFVFLSLLVWLLRRVRRRRQLLGGDGPLDNSQQPMGQASRGRNPTFTPFNFAAQNTSTQGLLVSPGVGGDQRSPQHPNSVHKPPLYGSASADGGSDIYAPDSPASSYSQTANTTLYGNEGGPFNLQGFTAIDRRPPTSINVENTSFTATDVPPPSYQASLGGVLSGPGYGTTANVGKS